MFIPETILASEVLQLEADLENRFLGNDLVEICYAAAESENPIFISTAGLPLENRQRAMEAWRACEVKVVRELSSTAESFIANAAHETYLSIQKGAVSLKDFNKMILDDLKVQAARKQRELEDADYTPEAIVDLASEDQIGAEREDE